MAQIHLPTWFNIIIADSYLHFTHTKFSVRNLPCACMSIEMCVCVFILRLWHQRKPSLENYSIRITSHISQYKCGLCTLAYMYICIWAWAQHITVSQRITFGMLNTHYSARWMTTSGEWFVCRTDAHTHIFTKCGTIILSNLLSRQILQIFVFSVVYNVSLCVCVGVFRTITNASSHICHKNPHTRTCTHTHILCMLQQQFDAMYTFIYT